MRAATLRNGQIQTVDLADLQPGQGQVLVKTLACGICGSDLHMKDFGPEFVEALGDGAISRMDFSQDVVMGHEFCGEILDHGPGTEKTLAPGTRVCSLPVVFDGEGRHTVGYSNFYPGGYAENMLLTEALLLEVPNGLATDFAAMTEPMAVGEHAVAKALLDGVEKPLVVGCGPVGLAVIAALKRRGIGPVTAADFSVHRRALAEAMGADVIVDPSEQSPYTTWTDLAGLTDAERGMRNVPAGVIFECVGVQGILDQVIAAAPVDTKIIVVGVCLQEDRFFPAKAIVREINLQFVLGYTPDEFSNTLRHIAEGELNVSPLITDRVDIDGVADAFARLATPDHQAKIMVCPHHS